MIELFEQDAYEAGRQSSKGNQLKWRNGEWWYKADYTGYEGLAEYVISQIMKKSDLEAEEYVVYEPEQICYKSRIYNGVRSRDFLKMDWQIITLERLFGQFFGQSFYKAVFQIADHEERLHFLVDQVERITGLREFGVYMNKVLTIDAVFLNEDRHLHNIAVLMNKQGEFDYCPIFDQGAGLLSDTTMDYPLEEDVYKLMEQVQAKTFSFDFDEQLDISEKLYGSHILFTVTKKEIEKILENAAIYKPEEKERVRKVLFEQMRKYQYLFG